MRINIIIIGLFIGSCCYVGETKLSGEVLFYGMLNDSLKKAFTDNAIIESKGDTIDFSIVSKRIIEKLLLSPSSLSLFKAQNKLSDYYYNNVQLPDFLIGDSIEIAKIMERKPQYMGLIKVDIPDGSAYDKTIVSLSRPYFFEDSKRALIRIGFIENPRLWGVSYHFYKKEKDGWKKDFVLFNHEWLGY